MARFVISVTRPRSVLEIPCAFERGWSYHKVLCRKRTASYNKLAVREFWINLSIYQMNILSQCINYIVNTWWDLNVCSCEPKESNVYHFNQKQRTSVFTTIFPISQILIFTHAILKSSKAKEKSFSPSCYSLKTPFCFCPSFSPFIQ